MQGFIALREIIKKLNSKFNKLFLTQISRKSLNMNYHKLNMNYFERFWNRFLKNFSRSDKNPAFFPRYASKAAARHPEGWRFQSEAGKESRAIAVPYQGTLNVFPLPYK